MSSVTFKIVLKRENRDPEIRRLTLPKDQVNLDSLRNRTVRLFQLREDQVWYFKWEDEEHDLVTLTEEYEFQEVIAAKSCDAVVRLHLYVEQPAPVIQVENCPRWHKFANRPCQNETPRYGALCDATNQTLGIEDGNWYHQLGTSSDLCGEEYQKLDESKKKLFVKIAQPSDLGQDQTRYELRCPRGKGRWRHGGGGRGRCHGGPEVTHVGWCDATNSILTPGCGWYHKKNENYDLVESEFNKLSASEKELYVKVEKGEDLGPDQYRYSTFRAMQNACGQGSRVVPDATSNCASSNLAPEIVSSPSRTTKEMKVVSGPSIADNTQVTPGIRLIPIWEVENTGQGEEAIWTDVRMRAKTGRNVFQLRDEGFEVPVLSPGSRGIASVEFVVPHVEKSGVVEGEFELVDGEGNSFGEPMALKLNVLVKEQPPKPTLPSVPNEKELVELLRDMGFGDVAACTQAIREAKGDVNAAALALLRLREE
eukprot:c5565_g1_i1.p1 GENE.c5565_g1_i1~~c5565_g1_i1.p1  ORF type:complete len:493 (-),score=114.04 c5565_g1_i1:1386-2828(-)